MGNQLAKMTRGERGVTFVVESLENEGVWLDVTDFDDGDIECANQNVVKNKHSKKRTKGTEGRSVKTKTPVLGVAQRGGPVQAEVVDRVTGEVAQKFIRLNVAQGSAVHTDDFRGYDNLVSFYPHSVVNHSAGQYVLGSVHTNTIESFWALFKRGYHGVYHWMSRKHMQRYVDEFAFRWNARPGTQKEGEATFFL